MKITKGQMKALTAIQHAIAHNEVDAALQDVLNRKLEPILTELAREPQVLAGFFAAAELHASPRAADLIARHVMCPDEVAKMVDARKAEIKAEKAERRAEKEAQSKSQDGRGG